MIVAELELKGVIVSGPLRSGTTWIYHTVCEHMGEVMLPEVTPVSDLFAISHVWEKYYESSRRSAWLTDLESVQQSLDNVINLILESAYVHQQIPVVKCPHLIEYPEKLRCLADQGWKLLVVYRDPLDVMASILHVQKETAARDEPNLHRNEIHPLTTNIWSAYAGVEQFLEDGFDGKSRNVKVLRYEEIVHDFVSFRSLLSQWLPSRANSIGGCLCPRFEETQLTDPFFSATALRPVPVASRSLEEESDQNYLEPYAAIFAGVRTRLGYV